MVTPPSPGVVRPSQTRVCAQTHAEPPLSLKARESIDWARDAEPRGGGQRAPRSPEVAGNARRAAHVGIASYMTARCTCGVDRQGADLEFDARPKS